MKALKMVRDDDCGEKNVVMKRRVGRRESVGGHLGEVRAVRKALELLGIRWVEERGLDGPNVCSRRCYYLPWG
jgi:hypothetical protein